MNGKPRWLRPDLDAAPRILTGLDLVGGAFAIRHVLFYRGRLDADALRAAWQDTLDAYPVLAARRRVDPRTGRLQLVPDPRGMPFRVGRGARWRPGADVDALLPPEVALQPWRDAPLCQVRITHLADDVTAVAYAISHHVADLRSVQAVLQRWAARARGEAPPPVGPSDWIAATATAAPDVLAEYTSRPSDAAAILSVLARARFVQRLRSVHVRFSAEDLAALAALAADRGVPRPSDALPGHVVAVLARLRGRQPRVTVARDLRGRLAPAAFWGNALLFGSAEGAVDDLASGARLVRAAYDVLDPARIGADIAGLEALASAREPVMLRAMARSLRDTVVVNDARRLPLYAPDLGAGPPVWLQTQRRAIPWSARLYPAPPSAPGAVDVWLKLPPAVVRWLATGAGSALLRPWRS